MGGVVRGLKVLVPATAAGLLVAWGGTAWAQRAGGLQPRPTPDPLPGPTVVQQAINPDLRVPGPVLFDPLDTVLTAEQRAQIERAHKLAFQQVQAALRYLRANSSRILSGEDPFYNSTFGQFYDRSQNNPLLGQYDQDVPAAIGEGRPLGIADVSRNMVRFEPDTPFRNNLRIGDRIIIGDQVHVIADIVVDTTNQTPGGGAQQQNVVGTVKSLNTSSLNQNRTGRQGGGQLQNLPLPILEEITLVDPFDDLGGQIDTSMMEIRRVVGLTSVSNREHYERTISTFEAIRDLMQLETTYVADWNQTQTAFNTIFRIIDPEDPNDRNLRPRTGAGVNGGDLPAPFVFEFMGRNFDRSIRQFGFSNSDSDLAETQRRLNPDRPLRWTEDIARVLDVNGNPVEGKDLVFFNDHMTIFGEFNQQTQQRRGRNQQPLPGTNTVYIGGGFLSENQKFAGDKFDSSLVRESKRTDLLQYQMIIAAFAEFAPDFFSRDSFGDPVAQFGAGFGIVDVVREFAGSANGTGQLPFPQNMDAETFAKFASIVGDPRQNTGIGDGTLLPPLGKNAAALSDSFTRTFPFEFQPIVPVP